MKRFLWFLAACVACIGIVAHAQNLRGSISGQVTDPTGAAIVGAKVTVTNTDNGAVTKTISRQEGLYNATSLLPGNYSISVTADGFKSFDRQGIVLQTQENDTINTKLEIGAASEVVTVTEAAPLIDTADASVGQVLTTEEVQDLPSDGSSALGFARIEYGVVSKGKHALGGANPVDNSTVDDFSLGGGNSASNELLLNGVPNMQDSGRTAGFSPQLDAVDAVRVDEFGANVTYGDTSGGTVNITTKSGTNNYHLTINERYQASGCSGLDGTLVSRSTNHCTWMSSLPWLHDAGGAVPSATHFNQFGGTLGGPITIPHVFNGHNKLFFFYAYEGYIGAQPMTASTSSVPTPAERQGDFSALLAASSVNQLYNPYSIVNGGNLNNFTRNKVPNNCLTATSSNCAASNAGLTLSPIALAYLNMVPAQNYNLTNGTGENNYFTYVATTQDYRSHQGRVDYNISANDKVFGEAHRSKSLAGQSNYFHNALSGNTTDVIMAGVTLEEVHTFSPTLILDTRGSLTRYDSNVAISSTGISPTTLGFPGYLASNSVSLGIPYISFSDSVGIDAYSSEPTAVENFDTVMLFSTLTKLYHTHTFLAGFDIRQLKDSRTSAGYDNGSFTFTNAAGSPVSAGSSGAKQTFGSSMALFMLGIPTSGSEAIQPRLQDNSWMSSLFLQDDWRPKPNLTVSYGIRLEHEEPVNESQDRMVNGFNPGATNEVTTAAQNAYLTNYTTAALLQPQAFVASGGVTYSQLTGVRHPYHTAPLYWSPRIGISWAPEYLKGKGVVRVGFGIYNSPFNNYSQGQTYGYSATSTYSLSSTKNFSDLGNISDPFPTSVDTASATNPMPTPANPIIQTTGDGLGVNQQLGSSIVFYPNHVKVPYSERLSLDLQYQIAKTVLIELGVIHNHQVHMSYSNDISQTPLLPYLSTSQYYDTYAQDKLSGTIYTGGPATTSVTNPFLGLTGMTGTYLTSTTMAPSRYLAAYPQYTSDVTEQLVPGSSAKYNALNARVAKTMGHGLTVNGIFEWSRLLGTFNQPNAGGPLAYGETTSDYPFHFSGYGTYDVPFGHGRQFFNSTRFLDRAIGGWQISAIYQFLSGTPDSWGNVIYKGTTWKDFNNKQHSAANWKNTTTFNTSVFDTRTLVNSALASQGDPGKALFNPAVQPGSANYRTFPNYLLRADYSSNWDGNVQKNVTVWREAKVELRLDCFNLLNRPQYAAPVLTPTSSTFGLTRAAGVLSGTLPRHFQLSAHVAW
jgi:hypothetical protein